MIIIDYLKWGALAVASLLWIYMAVRLASAAVMRSRNFNPKDNKDEKEKEEGI